MSDEIAPTNPSPTEPGDLASHTPKKKIAPEAIIGGLAVLGMVVVGVVMFVGGGSGGGDADGPSELTHPTEVRREAEPDQVTATTLTATTTQFPTATTLEPVATTTPTTAAPTTAAPTTAAPTTATETPPTTTSPDPEVAAAGMLAERVATDAAAVVNIEEHWVPQLSAKSLGTEWQGRTYDFQAILAEHEALRERYGAILVDGATYSFMASGQPMAGWFITLVPRAYPDPNGALAWCDAEQINSDDCFAKLITNRSDAGNTVVLDS